MEFGDDFLKALPTPGHMQLINYSDYDLNYWCFTTISR